MSDDADRPDGPPSSASTPEQGTATATRKPSQFHRRYQRSNVVVFDEEIRADLYRMWLEERHKVHIATSLSEAKETIDGRTTVAVVRWEISDQVKERIEGLLEERAPSSRVLLTRSTRDVAPEFGINYDIALQEPITKRGLTSAVDRLVARTKYAIAIQQYYQCTVEATNFEVKYDRETLADHEHYQRLQRHIDTLQQILDSLVTQFDIEDLDSVLSGIMMGDDTGEGSQSTTTEQKYRPDECPECGLEWGVDHGPSLGQGFDKLGAFV